MARQKKLKYHDLPWELKRRVDTSGPMMQPRKSENPTVQGILKRLKTSEEKYLELNASDSVKKKRDVIDLLESYTRDLEK